MLLRVICSAGLLAAVIGLPAAGQASDTCQRDTGGKCRPGEPSPPKLRSGVSTHQRAQPPAKGNHKGRDEYTPAQRAKYMDDARQLCRKTYGAPSRVYRIDYRKNLIWCEPPSY